MPNCHESYIFITKAWLKQGSLVTGKMMCTKYWLTTKV